jgi:hypothetical protein
MSISLYACVPLSTRVRTSGPQLYTEHTFEYRGHAAVWNGTGALSPAEMAALDAHCHDK